MSLQSVSAPAKLRTTATVAAAAAARAVAGQGTRSTSTRAVQESTAAKASGDRRATRREARRADGVASWESLFIRSLVTAGTCASCAGARPGRRQTVAQTKSSFRHPRTTFAPAGVSRAFSSVPGKSEHGSAREALDQADDETSVEDALETFKAEHHELVDLYDSSFDLTEESISYRLSDTNPLTGERKHYPLAPRLFATAEQEEAEQDRYIVPPEDEAHSRALEDFIDHLGNQLGRISLQRLWEHYMSLRTPRLRYLHDVWVRRFFRHLAWVETKDKASSDRFFALLEECVGERVRVENYEWNTAISFAGKWVRSSGTEDMRRAIETWMRMEEHGHMANKITFNILFDVAVRARRWGLADTIFHEIRTRKLPLNRYLRTTVILYAGLRGDGDGVRQAFHDFVNAGEIVDTQIMNAVIISLVRAGEPVAAEHVFLKMKNLSETRFRVPGPRDWHERKELTSELSRAAGRLRRERNDHGTTFFGSPVSLDRRREMLQEASPIGPDAWTYGILLRWHCDQGNNFVKTRALFTEMRARDLLVTNAIYIVLFRGFARHGGHPLTGWSQRALERYWAELRDTVEHSYASESHGAAAAESGIESRMTPSQMLRHVSDADPGTDTGSSEASIGLGAGLEPSLSIADLSKFVPFHAHDEPSRADDHDFGTSKAIEDDAYDADPDVDDDIYGSSADPDNSPYRPLPTAETDPPADAAERNSATSLRAHHRPGIVSRDQRPPHFTRALAAAVVEAFWTCAGRARMLAVWAEVQRCWPRLAEDDRAYVQRIVDRHVRGGASFRL